MSDISDINAALVSLISAAVYPGGVGNAPLPPLPVSIYAGWPDPESLDTDLGNRTGIPLALHVSVFNLQMERDTSRLDHGWTQDPLPPATYTAQMAGQAITIGGSAPNPYAPQNIAAIINGRPYVYQAAAGETPAQIATTLGALIAAGVAGTQVNGAVITLPASARIKAARVGVFGVTRYTAGRQQKGWQITIWADTPEHREALGRLVGPALRAPPRLALPDGAEANLFYRATTEMDKAQRQGAYRRDFHYSIEFATTLDVTAAQIVAFETEFQDPTGGIIADHIE